MRKTQSGILYSLVAVMGLITLVFADDHWSDDWKVTVDGKSKGSGTISFNVSFEPDEAGATRDPVSVEVQVPDGTTENDVAEMISNNFRAVLGEDDFKIDRSWGENVKLKTRGKTPDFLLEVGSNSVQGISLEIDD